MGPRNNWALFDYGFRPFFLANALVASLLIPWWAAALAWGTPLATVWPANLWHGKALALVAGVGFAAFHLHALTIGAAATMIMGVMTRASLGHTGRPLIVSQPIAYAYGLLTAAVRVLGSAWLPLPYTAIIALAAALWTAAFALFLWVHAPILSGPRLDGRPG